MRVPKSLPASGAQVGMHWREEGAFIFTGLTEGRV